MQSKKQIKPFLALPFTKDTDFKISEGVYYSKAETKIHGRRVHRAIDFAAKKGIKVYAAASGYTASSCNFAFLSKKYKGKKVGYAMGNFVQIWHPKEKNFTIYGHLDSISGSLPFFEGKKQDAIIVSKFYNQPLAEFLKYAKYIKRGTYLGTVGDSGLSLGNKNNSWDEPHLHFAVFTRKRTGKYKDWFDPYEINGKAENYIKYKIKPVGLWLNNGKREIVFAKKS